ncbi:uncharacterized protein [Ptychodera flava]|uniref:uncharacterized protein isoform X1 n=1 Tax=Ptychodera flava TaxID=63121 RepID=UPI003969FDC1
MIWLDDVFCTGTEHYLDQCYHLDWGSDNCEHWEDVSIKCANSSEEINQELSYCCNNQYGSLMSCPENIETYVDFVNQTAKVSWSAERLFHTNCRHPKGSHEPGSYFGVGDTNVTYDVIDDGVSCFFTVTVKVQSTINKGKVETLFKTSNGTDMNMSLSQIIERFSEFPAIISNLDKISFSSPEEIQAMVEEILEDINKGIMAILSVKMINETSVIGEELLIKIILDTTNSLSIFVLRNTEPGSGQVVLDTQYIRLNLESDSAEKVTDAIIKLGDGDGFSIPAAKKIFSNQSLDGAINRIATRFNRRSFKMKSDNNANTISTDFNVLSLSFTDRNGREIEAKETNEDIGICFASDPPPQETFVLVTGVYNVIDNVTYFGMGIEIKRLFHATIIWFENSDILYGNATAYVFKEEVEYSEEYRGYQFSVEVRFDVDHSSIFIPEQYFMMNGDYYMTFTLVSKVDVTFLMTLKQTKCNYLDDGSSVWNTDGCKISPASNITTTVCSCNHLTTFTEDKIFHNVEYVLSKNLRNL